MQKDQQKLAQLIQGKKVAFIGAGVSHKTLIKEFVELGAHVTLCDQKKSVEDFGDYAATIREPLDIDLNGRLVVSDLDYMNFTRYLHIVPGNYLLTVYQRTNPGGEPIINNRVQFQAGNYYLLSILGGPYDYSAQLVIS